jgi:hypothetical protein
MLLTRHSRLLQEPPQAFQKLSLQLPLGRRSMLFARTPPVRMHSAVYLKIRTILHGGLIPVPAKSEKSWKGSGKGIFLLHIARAIEAGLHALSKISWIVFAEPGSFLHPTRLAVSESSRFDLPAMSPGPNPTPYPPPCLHHFRCNLLWIRVQLRGTPPTPSPLSTIFGAILSRSEGSWETLLPLVP